MFKSIHNKIIISFVSFIILGVVGVLLFNIFAIKSALEKMVFGEHKYKLMEIENFIKARLDRFEKILNDMTSLNLNKLKWMNFNSIFAEEPDLLEFIIAKKDKTVVMKIIRPGKKVIDKKKIRFLSHKFEPVKKDGLYYGDISYRKKIPVFEMLSIKKECLFLMRFSLLSIYERIKETKVGRDGFIFATNRKGRLIFYPDIERVYAGTDFSSLEFVHCSISGIPTSSMKVCKDEKGRKIFSLCHPIHRMNLYLFTQQSYEDVMLPYSDAINRTILFSLILLSLILFVGVRISYGITHPISQLIQGAECISRGKFDIDIKINTNDELQILADTFNKMVTALRELENLRKDLISMLVHDMKSPLTSIIGALEYSIKHPEKDVKNLLSIARDSTESLYTMIQNLLDVSRMEEGVLKLNLRNINLNELIYTNVKKFLHIAKNEKKKITVEIDNTIESICVDDFLINRVLQNLLTNAIQHTTSGGNIKITVTKTTDNTIKFCVSDNGAGIPKEYKERIFEKFVQAERPRAHLRTGTGLGLTFCKMVVELHGGKIWVESEEGKGSAFYFLLPQNSLSS